MSWRDTAAEIIRNAPVNDPNKSNQLINSIFEGSPAPNIQDNGVADRHLRAMEQLDANPEWTYSIYSEERLTHYLLTIGIRDRGTVEIRIPKSKWHPAKVVEMLDRRNMH